MAFKAVKVDDITREREKRAKKEPWDISTLRGQAEEVFNSYVIQM